ncbi:hypothetical protein CHLRE_10g466700v5 [Chlamydomonas reinhardtii]|uniref:Uncharacterized protein n=1 Tax=Chlamydomonas reinhardtii TaxID=3055 RepID=A8I1T0_CHLRE|nr:uncharacterized protein CHLRE_10g466700v5 [Chlamydomonas reinhardtii]PNW78167.1 hypothetical protein CHLRE_10g466700v5 [Chlamydomonas reinhardtii]|eukprot:XP_001698645.1 oxygenase-like protein [Chlamydomonas reinhardtii]
MVQDVPIIDMSAPEAAAAAAVRAAAAGSGFFYVTQHGVSDQLVAEAFAQQRALFALPQETKMALLQDANNRGYTPFREETLDPANQKHGDTKEGFYFGREVAPDSPEASKPLHGPNQWPDPALLPDYRRVTWQYYEALNALGMRLLRLLALSLDLPAEHFTPMFTAPLVTLRPLHYAAEVSDPGAGVFGAGAHTDYGMLTILATDDVPGLQIWLPDRSVDEGEGQGGRGSWHDVAPVPGSFIINLGDMLERWTNGLYRSTLHRVINTTGRERYSIAFFFEPNFDTRVEVLPVCTGPGNPPRYPPTTSGEHLLAKYAQTHAGYNAADKEAEH